MQQSRHTHDDNRPYWPYWYIHGHYYDLTPWLEQHPGGAEFLLRLQGKDSTAAFELHHLQRDKIGTMLSTFEVKCPQIKLSEQHTVPQFNWQSYHELRYRVLKKLLEQQWHTGPSIRSRMVASVLLTINVLIPFFWSSAGTYTFLLAVIYAFNLIYISGFGHIFLHLNVRWEYLGDLGGFSSYDWKSAHCLEHHPYVNDPKYDPDVTKFLPLLHFSPQERTVGQIFAPIFILPLYAASFMLLRVYHGVKLFKNRAKFWSRLAPYLVGSFFWLFLWWVNGHLLIGILLEALASFIFLSWTLSSHNHLSCHNISEEKDFVLYQIKGCYDFGSVTYWRSLFSSAFLGSQTLHHLFPTLDPIYYPIIEKELKAMGYPYQRHAFIKVFWDHLRFICRI